MQSRSSNPVLRNLVLAVGSVVFVGGCARAPAAYEIEFITIDRAVESVPGRLEFVYHTIAESMFHSPGVDLARGGDEIEVRVRRTFYKDAGDPDVVATAGEPFQRRVEIELGNARAVVLTDGAHRVELWRDSALALRP